MADRSRCKVCGTVLTEENAYKRKDTYNKLHCYCKKHYLEIQKDRTKLIVENGKKFTTTVKTGNTVKRIFFDSLDEKHAFIGSRRSNAKCYRGNDTSVGIRVGSAASDGDPEFCDECGGTLRYDNRGFLCCEECGLLSDILPLYREVGLNMLHGRHSWNGEEADSMCCDTYYSTAYSKG